MHIVVILKDGGTVMNEDRCPKKKLATKLQMSYKGPYIITKLDKQNAKCFPFEGGATEMGHISKLKQLFQWGVGNGRSADPNESQIKDLTSRWHQQSMA